jgi:uncharacterized protein with PIN domain
VTVLDASALVSYLVEEPAAEQVEGELRAEGGALITTMNLAEVFDHLLRRRGQPEELVRESLGWILGSGLTVVPVEEDAGSAAGLLRARHYGRNRAAVSLADCVALAVSLERDAPLATTDQILARIARSEGCAVLALPDSRGRKPLR